jgi:hypothetical protein
LTFSSSHNLSDFASSPPLLRQSSVRLQHRFPTDRDASDYVGQPHSPFRPFFTVSQRATPQPLHWSRYEAWSWRERSDAAHEGTGTQCRGVRGRQGAFSSVFADLGRVGPVRSSSVAAADLLLLTVASSFVLSSATAMLHLSPNLRQPFSASTPSFDNFEPSSDLNRAVLPRCPESGRTLLTRFFAVNPLFLPGCPTSSSTSSYLASPQPSLQFFCFFCFNPILYRPISLLQLSSYSQDGQRGQLLQPQSVGGPPRQKFRRARRDALVQQGHGSRSR